MNSLFRFTAIASIGVLMFSSSCKKDDPTVVPVVIVPVLIDTVTVNYSSLSLGANAFWNGSDLSGYFTSNNATFYNNYTVAYSSWDGFGYSNKHDLITEGYLNQYSVYVSEADTNKFAVAYVVDSVYLSFTKPITVQSLKVANNTYAALLIEKGDTYTKKFGGITGNDADWFKITIKGYKNKLLKGTSEVFLADFTATDNTKDYILDKWKNVDLAAFGEVDIISFKLSSTDNGAYGMNTPAYFCLDDIKGTIVK